MSCNRRQRSLKPITSCSRRCSVIGRHGPNLKKLWAKTTDVEVGGHTMSERRVVIVGGGFGGVTLAQHLERKLTSDAEIVLISSDNHFVFTPMLAEVVGRSISALHMAVAGRQMVRRTRWLTTQVTDIDLKAQMVRYAGEGGETVSHKYDQLVLACGSVVNMTMMPGLAAYAYPMKTLGDAMYLSNDLISR